MDRLAGRAWEEAFSQVQNKAKALRFWHAGGIQVITSEGSIAGRILKRLPRLLTTERGLPALQKATQLSDKAMELLDDEATLRGANHFGATMYSVLHWAKFYTHHWYTVIRACKFGLAESAECYCCILGLIICASSLILCSVLTSSRLLCSTTRMVPRR